MLIFNHHLARQFFFAGETPSGDVESQTPRTTVDFSDKPDVIKKADRINVADEAKRALEIASYRAAYSKLEELAKKYAQELNQDMKIEEASKVRSLADQIGDTLLYQCDERNLDNVDPSTEKRWVDIKLVEQYTQLYDLLGQSPLASKDGLMRQIERVKIPEVRGTSTAQEIRAFRLDRWRSEQRVAAADFGMIGVVGGITPSVERAAPFAVPPAEQEKGQSPQVASIEPENEEGKKTS